MEHSLLTAVVVLLSLILLSLWLVLYQLVKQQGRMLLRLDGLEKGSPGYGQGTVGGVQIGPRGLGVGEPFDSFSLPDLAGQTVALEDFRGRRMLIVNWSPQCGFCDMIAPDLAKLQNDLSKRDTQLLFVSSGDADANRKLMEEHGLECPVLLLKEGAELKAFEGMGTPVAYLLDEEGRVAEPIAVGAKEVPELAREAAADGAKKKRLRGERPISESHIEREGLKAGTPAPVFEMPDIHGQRIALEDYRGRRVLLVFTDPHCGPCDQLAPDLVRLHKEHRDNGLALLMVGRGEAEENRRKAEQHGFEFPFILQDHWKLSRAYGIFATPVAFLINEQGVIARNVAAGADEILALAQEVSDKEKEAENG
ncbi:MAG TPA: redoxin domain-containing protein [Pyrinomonadaceae bacterium]|jgi:peroxiredoxin